MGHNVSDRKSRDLATADAAARRELAGWRREADGRPVELNTVEGAHARGAVVLGRCATAECRRRVEPDLADWIRHGFGSLPLPTLEAAFRCGRVGCRLTFQGLTYPAGYPVQCVVGTDSRLEVRCRECSAGRDFTAQKLIARLEAAGTGDGNSGINDLGRRIRGRCPACRYPGWIVTLRRSPAPGTPEHAAAQQRARGE